MARRKTRNLALSASQANRCANLGDLATMGWTKIPTYLSARTCGVLPLSEDRFNAIFGETIEPFSNQQGSTSSTVFSPNVATGESVNAPFYTTGIGIVAVGESLGFSVQGMTVPRAGTTTAPVFDGCVPVSADNKNAVLSWGHPIWDAFSHLFRGYDLQFILNGRFLLVNEPISEVGMTAEAAEFQGLGTANISGMPYIRAVNDAMKANNQDRIFLPQNAAGTACAQPPQPSVQLTHPKVKGLANRIFCLPRGILIWPGMSINVNLELRDDSCGDLDAMKRSLILQDAQTPDEAIAAASAGDNPTDVQTVPGGTFAFGVVMKGVELAPSACLDWFENYCPAEMASAYLGNAHVLNMATAYIQAGGNPKGVLAGLADPTGATLKKLTQG